jgi:flagellin
MRINNNLMAMNTHRQLGINAENGAKSIEKLSSGYRINRAGDDAAGLAISEKMRGQIRGLNQASRNSQDAISMIQTAEGALNETQAILQRMRELAVQSANDTNVDADRTSIQDEIDQLSTEITRIADTTEFNTQKLLDGTLDGIKFQIGANEDQDLSLSVGDMTAEALDVINETVTMTTQGDAIEEVETSDDFTITGASLSATSGGAVAAEMDALAAGIDTDGFADSISINYSKGVDNSGSVTLNDVGSISVSSVPVSGVDWSSIAASGGGFIKISFVTSGVQVVISGVTDTSGVTLDSTDLVLVGSGGDYTYSAHGLSFTLSSGEVSDLSGAVSGLRIDLNAAGSSGADVDFTSGIDIVNDFATNSGTSGTVAFSAAGITFDTTDADWQALTNIKVSGANLQTSGTAQIVVTLSGASGTLSFDTFTFSGGFSGGGLTSFTYDEHGVNFTVTIDSGKVFSIDKTVDTHDQAVDISGGDLKLQVTDDSGNLVSITVDTLSSGTYDLDDIAAAINAAASGSAGTFASGIAFVSGDTLQLRSAYEGDDSEITITDVGGFGDIFVDEDSETGADSTIVLTLSDSTGTAIGSTQTIQASDTSVTFTDDDGETATFTLEGYDSLTGLNIGEDFAASGFAVTEAGIDVSSQSGAAAAITVINDAIESVSTERSKLGAVQNRLEHTIKNLDTSAENLQASESRIRDVDMAKEMMEFTKNNILQQAAQSMLAQANQAPQGVLQLLR